MIVDNGGQYVHRIWRSLREIGVESEIIKPEAVNAKLGTLLGKTEDRELKTDEPAGFILSGGPTSVYEDTLGHSKEILNIDIPILGICWGHQFIAHSLGGKVKYGEKGEYGYGEIFVDDEDMILEGMPKKFTAWASHRDEVVELPPDFTALAHSQTCRIEAMRHEKRPIFGVQFHPEVFHTQDGKLILKNFADVCDKL